MPWPPQCAKKEPHEGWRGWRSREVPSSWNSRKGLLLYIVIDVKADLVQLCQKKNRMGVGAGVDVQIHVASRRSSRGSRR
jgi:hypothetical protein